MSKPVEIPVKKKYYGAKAAEAPVDKKVEEIANKAAHKAAKE